MKLGKDSFSLNRKMKYNSKIRPLLGSLIL